MSEGSKTGNAQAVMESLPQAKSFRDLASFMAAVASEFPEQVPIPTMRALIAARYGVSKNVGPHILRTLRDLGWIVKLNGHVFSVRYGHD